MNLPHAGIHTSECLVCFEDGAERQCCGAMVCEHCFTENLAKACPGCKQSTKNRPVRNADGTWSVRAVSADEGAGVNECRMCLVGGAARRHCCGEYFCNECYFKGRGCPSCGKPPAPKGLGAKNRRHAYKFPGFWPVISSVLLSVAVVVFFLGTLAALAVNEVNTVTTVNGLTCYGWFPKCDRDLCYEYAAPSIEAGITDLTTWRRCSATTALKMRGSACVYDRGLFRGTGHELGSDFCTGDVAEGQTSALDGGEFAQATAGYQYVKKALYYCPGRNEKCSPREVGTASFPGGAYLIEDRFDDWVNATLPFSAVAASATLTNLTGGLTSNTCDHHSGDRALYFFGESKREVQTAPLNVRHGGYVNFKIRFGQPPDRERDPDCREAFSGYVELAYSIDEGATWVAMRHFQGTYYKLPYFTFCSEPIPAAASTRATLFKWEQIGFENRRDHWALEDVNVFGNFKTGWDEDIADSLAFVSEAQCCFNSAQCQVTGFDRAAMCPGKTGGMAGVYNPDAPPDVRLDGVYCYLVVAAILYCARMWYGCVTDLMGVTNKDNPNRFLRPRTLRGIARVLPCFRAPAKVYSEDDPLPGAKEGSYRLKPDWKWRCVFASTTVVPFFVLALTALAVCDRVPTLRAHFYHVDIALDHVAIVFLAVFVDAMPLFYAARRIVRLLDAWLPTVTVDGRPSANCLKIGDDIVISLTDILDVTAFADRHGNVLGASIAVGAFPWALALLCAKFANPPFVAGRWFAALGGAFVCARAFFGVDVLVQVDLALKTWLLASGVNERNGLAAALVAPKVASTAGYCAAAGTTLAAAIHAYYDDPLFGMSAATSLATTALLGACGGAVYGVLLATLASLPAAPELFLTRVEAGSYIRFTKRPGCPCTDIVCASCLHCDAVHTRDKQLLLFVDGEEDFLALLRGGGQMGENLVD